MRSIDEYMWRRNTGRKKAGYRSRGYIQLILFGGAADRRHEGFHEKPGKQFSYRPFRSIIRKNLSR